VNGGRAASAAWPQIEHAAEATASRPGRRGNSAAKASRATSAIASPARTAKFASSVLAREGRDPATEGQRSRKWGPGGALSKAKRRGGGSLAPHTDVALGCPPLRRGECRSRQQGGAPAAAEPASLARQEHAKEPATAGSWP